jgi:hypothetical protein
MGKRIIKISDGLGNQLFQYALSRSLSLNGSNVFVDVGWFSAIEDRFTKRGFSLNKFNSSYTIADSKIIQQTKKPEFPILLNSIFWRVQNLMPYYKKRHFREQNQGYDKNVFNCNRNSYLDGFWQSYMYFDSIRNELLHEITLKQESNTFQLLFKEILSKKKSVAIHIRRGDYTNKDSVHLLITNEFYKNAIDYIKSALGSENHFYFFSDDLKYVEQQDYFKNCENKALVSGFDATEDLMLIKACNHQIISNSTFSWWGAWLNENPNKIVISPKGWMKEHEKENPYLIPNDWIKL